MNSQLKFKDETVKYFYATFQQAKALKHYQDLDHGDTGVQDH